MPAISTPCVKLCVLDRASGLCQGCGRTAGEIGRWLSMGEPERLTIMRQLPERIRRLGPATATTGSPLPTGRTDGA